MEIYRKKLTNQNYLIYDEKRDTVGNLHYLIQIFDRNHIDALIFFFAAHFVPEVVQFSYYSVLDSCYCCFEGSCCGK